MDFGFNDPFVSIGEQHFKEKLIDSTMIYLMKIILAKIMKILMKKKLK